MRLVSNSNIKLEIRQNVCMCIYAYMSGIRILSNKVRLYFWMGFTQLFFAFVKCMSAIWGWPMTVMKLGCNLSEIFQRCVVGIAFRVHLLSFWLRFWLIENHFFAGAEASFEECLFKAYKHFKGWCRTH